MKKCVSVIGLLGMFIILLCLPEVALSAPVGKFTSVQGRVDITSPGKAARDIKVGDEVAVGDIVRTKSESKAEITFVDDSVMRIAPKSRVKITEYMVGEEKRSSILSLFRGKIQNIVKNVMGRSFGRGKKDRYEVHTRTAVVGVRGTNFITYYQKEVTGSVCIEGNVFSYSANRPGDIRNFGAGQGILVVSADEPPMVKPATDVEMQEHLDDVSTSGTSGGDGGDGGGSGTGGLEGNDIVNTDNTFQQQQTSRQLAADEIAILGDLDLGFLDEGSMGGILNTTSNRGNVNLDGTYAGSPAGSHSGTLQGTLGSGAFSGDMGLAIGSLKGVYSTIYTNGGTFVQDPTTGDWTLNNAGVGYLYGAFSGVLDDALGTMSASGSAYRSGILGNVDVIDVGPVGPDETPSGVLPERLADNFVDLQSGWDLPIPVLGSINAGGNFGPGAFTANITSGGLETTSGRRIGVWGVDTTGGMYTNAVGPTWYGVYGELGAFGSPAKYYLLGKVTGTDDMAGHLSVDGTLTYLDRQYLGTVNLWNRGTYDAARNYQSAGAGAFTLNPLVLAGETEGALMYFDGEWLVAGGAGYGLLGSTAASPDQVTILGHYEDWAGQDAYLMYGSGFYFFGGAKGGSPSGDEAFSGYLVGNMRNGEINARTLALAIADGQAGTRGGPASGFNYAFPDSLNLFSATSGIPFSPREPTTVNPGDLEASIVPYFFGGYGSGTFQAGGTLFADVIMGDPIRINGHDWGIWNGGFGGTYAGNTSDAWTLVHGADFWGGVAGAEDWGLLLGRVTDTTWGDPDISGIYTGTAITTEALYDLTGPVSGTRKETGASGNWQAAGIGTFERRPLTFFSESWAYISDTSGITGDLGILLGGDTSLWGPNDTPITGIGIHWSDYGGDSSIWLDPYFYSWNERTWDDTTLEDVPGSFTGVIGGIKNGNALEALIAALYIDPWGNTGFLTSTDTRGTIYNIDEFIGILEMNGTIQRRQMATNIGIAPEDLWENVFYGVGAPENIIELAGTLGTAGNVTGMGSFDTISIKDAVNLIAPPWGIYYAHEIYGDFDNPENATTWNSRVGGGDYFGVFFDQYGDYQGDQGFFYGNTASTWNSNRLEADLTAAFMTRTKMGGFPWQPPDTGLHGKVLGTYTYETEVPTFEAVSVGTWVGEPLSYSALFESPIRDYYNVTGYLKGFMGGTGSLWNAASTPVGFMGEITPLEPGDIVGCTWLDAYSATSYNPMTGLYTTLEQNPGAFIGVIGGRNSGNTLDALFGALYIGPSGASGFLTSTDITGTSDWDLNQFLMTGNIQRTQMTDDIGILPEDLINNLHYGVLPPDVLGNIILSGSIGENGWIMAPEYHPLYPGNRFDTISILDEANMIAPAWGLYYATLFGEYDNPYNATTWSSTAGGFDNFGAYFVDDGEVVATVDDFGHFIAQTASSWNNNRLSADLDGRFLALGKMGGWPWQGPDTGLNGKVLGTYNPSTGTWEAVSLGTWVGEPTTFSSDFRINEYTEGPNLTMRMVPGTSYEGSFERWVDMGEWYESTGYYDYEYFISDNPVLRFGEKWYADHPSGVETGDIYLPTGETLQFSSGWSPYSPFRKTGHGDWDVGSLDPPFFSTPPDPGPWERGWYSEWPSNALAPSGEITGMLAGTENLWAANAANPANFGIMGTYTPDDGDYSNPSFFGVDLVSSEITNGHYRGFIGGVIDDVKGLGLALYQSPVWDDSPPVGDPGYPIGILTLNFAGPVHPDIGMWEAAGTVYPTPMGTVFTYPEDFSSVVEEGFIAGWMNGGNESGGPMIGSELAWGTTMSTLGHDNWGIFNMLFGYGNYIQGSGTWPDTIISGWGEFGHHWTSGGGRIEDIGMWITNPFTVTANSPLQASFTGELLTYSKWAQISGQALGAWDAATNSWMGGAGGFWQNGTPLAFNGILDGDLWHKVKSYRGGWSDESSDYFWYDYWEGSNSGWFTTEQGGVKTHKDYFADGTFEMWTDDNGTLSYGEGTWDTSQPLLNTLIAQADASTPDPSYRYDEGPFFDVYEVGWWNALAGSFENLWTATQADPAQTRIIGEFDTWNDGISAPPVFASEIRSHNPYDGTATIWNQSDNSQNGAYYGYVAGRALDENKAEGGVLALGMDKNGNAHFIVGPVNINTYPDAEILEGQASVFPIEVVQGTGYDAADFHPGGLINESMEWWDVDGHGQFLDSNDNAIGGDIHVTDRVSSVSRTGGEIDGEPWALAARVIVNGGKYDELEGGGTSNFWEIPYATNDGVRAKRGALFSSNESDLTRGEWQTGSAGKIAGKGYGGWVNWDAAVTGISGGDIKGTFDPNTRTWQTAALWASMDTKTFNNLLSTPEGREKIKLLNMPYVQIGQTALSQGAGTVNGLENVTMNDVKFLAYSTGGAPRAFLSPDVHGSHVGAVTPGGAAVPLTGAHGVNAGFQVNRWDGAGGNWGANITGGGTYTGAGTMNGTTIQMNGFGAGKINQGPVSPGSGTTTFTGTAAGTASAAPAP